MYIRQPHREEDTAKILEFISQNEFATLVTFDGEKPIATHLLLSAGQSETGEVFLEGHLARANPQWKTFNEDREALAIFFGAHAYLSPTWYAEPEKSVPTWNYVSAHVYGKPKIVEDEAELLSLMKKLVGKYESDLGYKLENLPPDYLGKQLKGIVGFRIEVTRIEASYKLAQTLDSKSYENVIVQLEKSNDENSKKIAEAMRLKIGK
jgi:transcriptional regulator